MPTVLFDIPNPPANTLILDDTRQGRVQFTVNNVSGRPLTRVAARLTAMPESTAPYGKWLKVAPDGFREFKIADSLQYTALIAVPPDGAAGSYSFRLDVWDDANPDDTLANGPGITFTVPPAPAPKPKAAFPWWIPAVIVALVVLIVGVVLLTRPSPPTPPPTRTFAGHWNLAGASQTAGAIADLQLNGTNLTGTFFNGSTRGTLAGVLSGESVTGKWRNGFAFGTFVWTLSSSGDQFQGSWDGANDWCGFRDGSSAPVPCRPPRLPLFSSDVEERARQLTPVAP
jgi:hypothetical protein